jgi:hypothetical protein
MHLTKTIICLALVSFPVVPVLGDVIEVPDDFDRIQDAIAAAEDNDIISVWGPAPGQPDEPPYVYQENIDFMGKAITVVNRGFIPGQVPEEPDWDYVAIDGR